MTSSSNARNELRTKHRVRLVQHHEEGTAAEHLPGGVYGFTNAPALAAPLFSQARYRNFEVHRLPDGERPLLIVGFVTPTELRQLTGAGEPVDITLYPEIEGDATEIVAIPASRIVHHREYAIRNTAGIVLRVTPENAYSAPI